MSFPEIPNDQDKCRMCGGTYSEHEETRSSTEPIPRVPCTLLKSGFVPKVEKPTNPTGISNEVEKIIEHVQWLMPKPHHELNAKGEQILRDKLNSLLSTRDELHHEVLSTKNLAIRELYEALEMMFEQYCPNGEHQFIMAGEVSEELLDKYKPLVDELISKGEVK